METYEYKMTEQTAFPDDPSGSRTKRASSTRPYHHGSLCEALLQAAETVLKRDGLRRLTLRSIAREAGVSHAAPQHHFGDIAGVLSELAAIGHRRLANEMAARASGNTQPGKQRRRAIAHGYIDFAVSQPDLFRLMSRNELLEADRPALVEARHVSTRMLAGAFDAVIQPQASTGSFAGIDGEQAAAITAAWSYVHGLATLLVEQRLDGIARRAPEFADARALVDAAIDEMQIVADT